MEEYLEEIKSLEELELEQQQLRERRARERQRARKRQERKRRQRQWEIIFWTIVIVLTIIVVSLFGSLKTSFDENKAAKEQIQIAQQERDNQMTLITQLKKRIQELSFQNELNDSDGTAQELNGLLRGVEELELQNETLLDQCEDVEAAVAAIQEKVAQLQQQVDNLEKELQEQREEEEQEEEKKQEEFQEYYNLDRYKDRDYSKVVYLTFDDGPTYMTPKVLDILDQYGVKATFFVTYKTYQGFVPYYKEIVNRGHAIGVHTAKHDYDYIYSNMDNFISDFNLIYNWIEEQTGVRTTLYRFPGGSKSSYNENLREDIKYFLKERGMMYYDWNVTNGDGGTVTADEAYHNVVDNIRKSAHPMILMHDTKQTTVDALPRILEQLIEWGYTFESITSDVKPVWFSGS